MTLTWDRYNGIYMRTDLNGVQMASSDSLAGRTADDG